MPDFFLLFSIMKDKDFKSFLTMFLTFPMKTRIEMVSRTLGINNRFKKLYLENLNVLKSLEVGFDPSDPLKTLEAKGTKDL